MSASGLPAVSRTSRSASSGETAGPPPEASSWCAASRSSPVRPSSSSPRRDEVAFLPVPHCEQQRNTLGIRAVWRRRGEPPPTTGRATGRRPRRPGRAAPRRPQRGGSASRRRRRSGRRRPAGRGPALPRSAAACGAARKVDPFRDRPKEVAEPGEGERRLRLDAAGRAARPCPAPARRRGRAARSSPLRPHRARRACGSHRRGRRRGPPPRAPAPGLGRRGPARLEGRSRGQIRPLTRALA